MKTLTFLIQAPRQAEQLLEVASDRLLIGSGAHCDIRLALDSAAWEHIVVTQEDEGVIARVVAAGVTAELAGEIRREAKLDEGATMRVDTTYITLKKIAAEDVKKSQPNAARAAVALLSLIVMATAFLLYSNASEGANDPAPKAPDPLGKPVIGCTEKQAALPLAQEKVSLARAKRERFRFYPHDGVEGVALFQGAAACFEAGKAMEEGEGARNEAAELAGRIRDIFHASRVRLERALVRKDARTALAEVKFQRDLLFANKDAEPYCLWLSLLQSKLESIISKESR